MKSHLRGSDIFAHNGGGWDYVSLVQWWLKHKPDGTVLTIVMIDSCVIACNLSIIDENITVRFLDSYHLLKSGLNKSAKAFIGKEKINVDGKNAWKEYKKDKEKVIEYVKQDCILLLEILEKFADIVFSLAKIPRLGITLPATSLAVFKTGYLKRDIMIPNDDDEKEKLREAYHGGRVEVFKMGEFEKVKIYDINSLYPYIMKTLSVPVCGTSIKVEGLEKGVPGCYKIRWNQRDEYPAILLSKGKGAKKGEGWYFSPEVELLDKYGVDYEVLEGMVYNEHEILFSDFVDILYNFRMKNKENAIGEVCKLLMNSLYGKFGQRPERSTLFIANSFEEITAAIRASKDGISIVSIADGIYSGTEEAMIPHEHVGIAGMITSGARAYLYNAMRRVKNGHVIYCDTDSVHIDASKGVDMGSSYIGGNIGQFKREFEGCGIYLGKKMYALQNSGGDKVRIKGVRISTKKEDGKMQVTYKHLKNLMLNGSMECRYETPSTMREVLKGKSSCQFRQRKRIIRPTT